MTASPWSRSRVWSPGGRRNCQSPCRVGTPCRATCRAAHCRRWSPLPAVHTSDSPPTTASPWSRNRERSPDGKQNCRSPYQAGTPCRATCRAARCRRWSLPLAGRTSDSPPTTASPWSRNRERSPGGKRNCRSPCQAGTPYRATCRAAHCRRWSPPPADCTSGSPPMTASPWSRSRKRSPGGTRNCHSLYLTGTPYRATCRAAHCCRWSPSLADCRSDSPPMTTSPWSRSRERFPDGRRNCRSPCRIGTPCRATHRAARCRRWSLPLADCTSGSPSMTA